VYQAGLCTDMTDYLQRAGRIRSKNCILVLLFEPWAIASEATRSSWNGLLLSQAAAKSKPIKKERPCDPVPKRQRLQPCILGYVNLPTDTLDGAAWCHRAYIIKYNGHQEHPGECNCYDYIQVLNPPEGCMVWKGKPMEETSLTSKGRVVQNTNEQV
jgi:hypothetical protein